MSTPPSGNSQSQTSTRSSSAPASAPPLTSLAPSTPRSETASSGGNIPSSVTVPPLPRSYERPGTTLPTESSRPAPPSVPTISENSGESTVINMTPTPAQEVPSYRVKPPPLPPPGTPTRPRASGYIPDEQTLASRPVRRQTTYAPYTSRPVVIYSDPYNNLFWWWLLDRSVEQRTLWTYHHRYNMDPERYHALVAADQGLESRLEQLEANQVPRDPQYVPSGLDSDLMYSDRFVTHTYSNRPTVSGRISFWIIAVPAALGALCFLIWLVFVKRWQTATC